MSTEKTQGNAQSDPTEDPRVAFCRLRDAIVSTATESATGPLTCQVAEERARNVAQIVLGREDPTAPLSLSELVWVVEAYALLAGDRDRGVSISGDAAVDLGVRVTAAIGRLLAEIRPSRG